MRAIFVVAVGVIGCTPMVVEEPIVPSDCGIEIPTMAISGTVGAHVTVMIPHGRDVTARIDTVISVSDSYELSSGTLRVKLPNRVGPTQLLLSSTCDGVTRVDAVPFEVKPLAWSPVAQWTGAAGPSAREYFSMWMQDDQLFVFGGFVYVPQQFTPNSELWSFSTVSSSWSQLTAQGSAPPYTGGRLAQLPDGSSLYLGGFTSTYETPYALNRLRFDSGAATWSNEPTASGEGLGDYQPGFFFDAKRNRLLSVCGASTVVGYHCDVREFVPDASGGHWRAVVVSSGPSPEGRNGHAYGYDEVNDRLVLFGGDVQGSVFGDTWFLELGGAMPTWVRFQISAAPDRRNMAFAIDPLHHRFLVWGGTADGRNAVEGLWALDLDKGDERWTELPTTNPPTARASGAAVFDAKRKRMVMGFGNTISAQYADLWALDLL